MGVDYNAFSCIGYEFRWTDELEEKYDDYENLNNCISEDIDDEIRIVHVGNMYEDDTSLYIFFESMFEDGIYQEDKQKILEYVIHKYEIETIGSFDLHDELNIS